MPIFSEMSIISCLSMPMQGLYTGRVQTSPVTISDCIVCEATCPMLSPVMSPRHSL